MPKITGVEAQEMHGHGTRRLIPKLIREVSAYDNTLFLCYNAIGNLIGILARHVDDSINCGKEMFKRKCEYRTKKNKFDA